VKRRYIYRLGEEGKDGAKQILRLSIVVVISFIVRQLSSYVDALGTANYTNLGFIVRAFIFFSM